MKTPFTTEQFFLVFENYNLKVFPVQLFIVILGVATLLLIHLKNRYKNRLIGCYLGLLWIWTGLVYHIVFFSAINKDAYVFGGIFILQGILIFINTFNQRLIFTFTPQSKDYAGYFLILFGLIIYPIIGIAAEGTLVRTITLGLPCPSTIFTFGLFLLTMNKFPKYLLIIPSLWAIVGLSAAINFGVVQDYMIIISAIIADIILLRRNALTTGIYA